MFSRLSYIVFRKELRETLRDKRVLLGVIVSPLIVTPLILGTVLFFGGKKEMQKMDAILNIGIVEQTAFPELIQKLEDNASIETQRFETRDDVITAVEERIVRAALVVSETARNDFQNNQSVGLEIIFTFANETSQNANNRLRKIIGEFDQYALAKRIQKMDLPESFANPTSLKVNNIATSASTGSFLLGLFLPYLIVISAAFGGIQTAFDLCAGEKERSTMETLLVSPASRFEIVQGKLFTIFTISLIAALCAITGIVAPLTFGLDILKDTLGDQISIKLSSVLAML